jgi:hypothetical protein
VPTHPNTSPRKSPRALLAGFVLLAALAAALAPTAARGTVSYDFEGPVYYRPGELVKDHSLILIDGTFHLYFITTGEKTFGHATSPDLRHWTRQPDVLAAGPESWDSHAIWAPAVVRYPRSPYYLLMYFTGVNNFVAQSTGLAMSNFPSAFYKAPEDLFTPFHGDTTWMYWHENEWSNYRDPGFFTENDTCYLVQTAHTIDWNGAIALASSTDYFTWHDDGPIYVHPNWHALESVFLMKHGGRYHLFFTEETVGGISHMSSASLRSGWDIEQRTIIDDGAAAEVLDLGNDRYIFSRHTRYSTLAEPVASIRFDSLGWNGDQPHVEKTNLLAGWTILWGKAFNHQPVFGNNPRFRGDFATTVGFEGNWWIGTYERFNGPISRTFPGDVQGDSARGAIRSDPFVVTGSSMRLLVGGGAYPDSCYVALCDAATGGILRSETGKNTDRMDERFWDLASLRGKRVYLTIVDNCISPFGHINVDGIEERAAATGPGPGGREARLNERATVGASGPSRAEGDSPAAGPSGKGAAAGEAEAFPPERGSPSLSSSPNPFNPMTAISVRGAPGETVTVSIYDVTGRSLCDLRIRTDSRGEATLRWGGTDRRGAALPSGVYLAVLSSGGRVLASSKLVLAR